MRTRSDSWNWSLRGCSRGRRRRLVDEWPIIAKVLRSAKSIYAVSKTVGMEDTLELIRVRQGRLRQGMVIGLKGRRRVSQRGNWRDEVAVGRSRVERKVGMLCGRIRVDAVSNTWRPVVRWMDRVVEW